MSDATARHASLSVRASDAERECTVALLRQGFADGRLTQAELEERATAAYQARTVAKLSDLTADLPTQEPPPRPGWVLDLRLLRILLCVHPLAALVYWLISLGRQPGIPDPSSATARKRGKGAALGVVAHGRKPVADDPDRTRDAGRWPASGR